MLLQTKFYLIVEIRGSTHKIHGMASDSVLAAQLDICDMYSDSDEYETEYDSCSESDEAEPMVDLSDCASYSILGQTDPLERDHCRFVTCLAGENMILRSDGSQCHVLDLTAGMTLWSVDGTIDLHAISKVAPGSLKMFTNN